MVRAVNGKEWRQAVWQKKEEARQALILRSAKKQAVRYIKSLRQLFPRDELIQLLYVMLKDGQLLACQMATDAIERAQGSTISAKDRDFLQKIRGLIAEQQGRRNRPERPAMVRFQPHV